MAHAADIHAHDDHGHGHDDHYDPGFWRKWVFSTDHKMIGIQYGLTGLLFLFFGFLLMLVMRWQLAHPGLPVPVIGVMLQWFFGDSVFQSTSDGVKGVLTSAGDNVFGSMPGTIMVLFVILLVAVAA